MSEITKDNFKAKLPDIKKSLKKAKFISLDLEFSALQPIQATWLFDNNEKRYAKLRKNLLNVIPLQVGITAFHFNNDTNDYFGEVFTFYVCPTVFMNIDKTYYFQASSTNFLCLHNFDFNKFAHSGIPFLNDQEEALLRKVLKRGDSIGENCQMKVAFQDVVNTCVPIISKWYKKSKIGDTLEIPTVKKYEHSYEIVYFLHLHLRSRFKNLWTHNNEECFCIKKVSNEDFQLLLKQCTLNEKLLDTLIGFKHVFNILTTLRKPIIGHNILQDLMIMINNFGTTLPKRYSQFKDLTNDLFPTIFDTKTVYYELRRTIPKEKLPAATSLETLFHYFKDGQGRHLAVNSTAIECDIDKKKFYSYHEAGWDSFCTGYIFLRMGYYHLSKNYPKGIKFVPSELINGLSEYKNRVNLIRGATSYIRVDGEDPAPNRPPWLIVETLKNEPVDVSDLMSDLSCYGFVDIKKMSSRGNRVLVAADTFRTARDISEALSASPKFRVKQYSFLKHSPIARAIFLGAVTISGTVLLWLTHRMAKR